MLAGSADNGQLRTWRFEGSRVRQRRRGTPRQSQAGKPDSKALHPNADGQQDLGTQNAPPKSILAARKALLASLLAAEDAESEEAEASPDEAAEGDKAAPAGGPPAAEAVSQSEGPEPAVAHVRWDPWGDYAEDLPLPRHH